MEGNEMDAFKELMKRAPEFEVATLEDLKKVSIFSKAAAIWGMAMYRASQDLGLMAKQSQQFLEDSQRAMEVHLESEKERGRRAKAEPTTTTANTKKETPGPGAGMTGSKPKWERLGFKSEDEMFTAEFLNAHPAEVEEVIAEAKEENDVPSKGAVKNRVRAKKAEAQMSAMREKRAREAESPKVGGIIDTCVLHVSELNMVLGDLLDSAHDLNPEDQQKLLKLGRLLKRTLQIIKERGTEQCRMLLLQ